MEEFAKRIDSAEDVCDFWVQSLALSEDDRCAYGAVDNFNGLVKYDLQNGRAFLIDIFPQERKDASRLFSDILKYGEWLLFAPLKAQAFVLYNIDTKEMITFDVFELLQNLNIEHSTNTEGFQLVLKEHFGYAIYRSAVAVIRFDFINKKAEPLMLANNSEGLGKIGLTRYRCQVGECVYIPSLDKNCIFEFDMTSELATVHPIELKRIKKKGWFADDICFDGEKFWLLGMGEKLLFSWNNETGEIIEYIHFEYAEKDIVPYGKMCIHNNRIVLFPCNSEYIAEFDLTTKDITEKQWLEGHLGRQKNYLTNIGDQFRFIVYDKDKGSIYDDIFISEFSYNVTTSEFDFKKPLLLEGINPDELSVIAHRSRYNVYSGEGFSHICEEDEKRTLKGFLFALENELLDVGEGWITTENIGKKIWEKLK